MVNLLYTELLKLKRSRMVLLSFLGAIVAPFMIVVASYVHMKTKQPTETITFEKLFFETNLYTILVIGVPLYGVVTTYLFNREFLEDTLKNLLTIPISRISYIISKLIVLLVWIVLLTATAWVWTLVLGMLGGFEGLDFSLVKRSFIQFMVGGGLLFLLSTPAVLVTIMTKNYVPTIIFTVVVTLLNVMSANSEHRGLFPWAAAGDIANQTLLPTYPPEYSYTSIGITVVVGFVGTIVYFLRMDVD